MDCSDIELIEMLRQSSEKKRNAGLELIYKSYYPMVETYVIANSGDHESAADVFQEAVIVLYEKVRKSDFELTSSIKTYLYSVSKYIWLNRLRANKRNVPFEEHDLDIELIENLTEEEQKQSSLLLSDTIGQLGDTCKKVILLYYYHRFRMKKIATEMGFSNEQVAKNKKAACMKTLRNLVLQSDFLKENLR